MTDNRTDQIRQTQQLLQQGRFADAQIAANQMLEDDPADQDGLYILAVSQRYQGQLEDALNTLSALKSNYPGYGRGWQEEGHVFKSSNQPHKAVNAYQEAVRLNPALLASWQSLVELSGEIGDTTLATFARGHLDRLSALPRELISVTSFISEGQLYKAEQLCRVFLQNNPHHIEAMRLLAQIGLKLNVLDDAEFLLESVLEFQPDYLLARLDYVEVLNRRQKYDRAFAEAETLLKLDPDNPSMQLMHANALMAVGHYDEALALFDKLEGKAPDESRFNMARGHAFKTVGDQDQAVRAYQAAYNARPDFGDAYWSLANLKIYQFSDQELQDMQTREADPAIGIEDRYHLCFALGKAFEDQKDYQKSFEFYERGNQLKSDAIQYSADRMESDFKAQKAACTRSLFEERTGQGAEAPDPIFIVGLPRAGSTLLEQILASHSQVDGTLELPNILATAHRLGGRRKRSEDSLYPSVLADLTSDQLKDLGEKYIEDTRIHRDGAPFFTDKMPNNFRHIGLIKLILPNAKIIDARRAPMACCFSGFKQLFAEGQEFTYGLDNIGRYYRDYVELMRHWHEVLPGDILSVQYEDVVEDLETQVRRILDYCGLDFEPGCVEFHKTERAVRTASSEQVRQPIYKSGVEQWKHFEPWLDPLKSALGPTLTSYREHGGA